MNSDYVEHFWLPVLGPSSVFLLRRIHEYLQAWPTVEFDITDLATDLGVQRQILVKTVQRLQTFGVCNWQDGTCHVAMRLAPLSQINIGRLSPTLQAWHAAL